MQFHVNPLPVFAGGVSPIAIHARLRWMNGGAQDRALARRAIEQLRRNQAGDGSWRGSAATTIEALFALWLLEAAPDRMTASAINWLLEVPQPLLQNVCGGVYDGMFFRVGREDRARFRQFRSLPFTTGCGGFVKTGAALFFATAFGQGEPDRVGAAYERAEQVGRKRKGRWCTGSCGNNILQAFAAHPKYSGGPAMRLATADLYEHQDSTGKWSNGAPFFPTLLALSRLKAKPAQDQAHKALRRAADTQNRDGSWGRAHQEFNAYAVLDAAERVGSWG